MVRFAPKQLSVGPGRGTVTEEDLRENRGGATVGLGGWDPGPTNNEEEDPG